MNMKKRVKRSIWKGTVSVILSLAMLLSVLEIPAYAETATEISGTCGEHITWTLDSDGILTIRGTGEMVNELASDSGNYNIFGGQHEDVKKIVIEEGITSIADTAFYNLQIDSVSIPEGVTKIDKNAFGACMNLTSVTLPESLEEIGDYAFWGCKNLTDINMPDHIKKISDAAFSDTNIEAVSIPASLETIGDRAFGSCPNLREISVASENVKFKSENGILFNKDQTTLIKYPAKKPGESYAVPDAVTEIGACAFAECIYLTDITLPDTVTKIDQSAFQNCSSLQNIKLSNQIWYIGMEAFRGCESLTSITIPKSVALIDGSVFAEIFSECTSLEEIIVEDGNEKFTSEGGVLYSKDKKQLMSYPAGKQDSTYVIPDSVEEIFWEAFLSAQNLTDITIPGNVEHIGYKAFYGCQNLKNVTIENDNVDIGFCALGYYYTDDMGFDWAVEIKNFVIYGNENSNAQKYAEENEFIFAPIGTIVHTYDEPQFVWSKTADGYEAQAVYAYSEDGKSWGSECMVTSKITKPATDTETGVICYTATGFLDGEAYTGTKQVEIPIGGFCSTHTYDEEPYFRWEENGDTYTAKATFSCSEGDFEQIIDCAVTSEIRKKSRINYSASVEFQGKTYTNDYSVFTFAGTPEMSSGKCGDHVTWVLDEDGTLTISGTGKMDDYDWGAPYVANHLWDDQKVTKVIVEEGVTKIGNRAFTSCENIESVKLPSTLTHIGEYAFCRCRNLTKIMIPEKVTEIEERAFETCENLNSIAIESDNVEISEGAIGYDETGNGYPTVIVKKDDFIIYGHIGSTAEQYAEDNGFTFEELKAHVHTYGDPVFTWTQTNGGYTATAAVTCSAQDDTLQVPCTVTKTTKEATYEADGQIVYMAKATWKEKTYTETKTVTIPQKTAEEKIAEETKTEETKTEDTTQVQDTSQSDDTKESDAAGKSEDSASQSDDGQKSDDTQTGWVKDGDTWHFNNADGETQTGWINDGGKWYYTDDSGAMQTGWVQDGDTWYYTSASGEMQTGWVKDGDTWYYTDNSGEMQTGWVQDGNTWYFTNASGAMQTGWVQDGNTWYYTNTSGAMQTGWVQDGNTWYYTNAGGAMQTGWIQDKNTWYYTNAAGAMLTGWQQISGKWYYLNDSGAMQTGWYTVNTKWYYSYASGEMAANTRIGNYRVNAKGEWVR